MMALVIASCKKDDDTKLEPPYTAGNSRIFFEIESVDSDEVALELGKVYTTSNMDSVRFDAIRYWLSNIEFIREDGSIWKEENSYRLIENSDKNVREAFDMLVPVGKYKGVRYSIGVAPNQNSSLDSIIGELNANLGMSWNWNTGYIFMKNDGEFYNSDSMAYTPFQYHIGTDANYKTITFDFPATMEFEEGHDIEAHIVYRALNLFTSPNTIDIKSYPMLHVGPAAQTLQAAENYSSAFELHHFKKN